MDRVELALGIKADARLVCTGVVLFPSMKQEEVIGLQWYVQSLTDYVTEPTSQAILHEACVNTISAKAA